MKSLRKPLSTALLSLALAGAAFSEGVDVDGDLMRGIADTAKSLDSDVAMKDAKPAAAEARSLVETFAKVESHYDQKPDTTNAVSFARSGSESM